jgi:Zn-dependent M16 (insulinase) family peptidase
LKANTGGRLKELRDITNERIRNYHKQYYAAENICIVVTGPCKMEDICERMKPVLAKSPAQEFVEEDGRKVG